MKPRNSVLRDWEKMHGHMVYIAANDKTLLLSSSHYAAVNPTEQTLALSYNEVGGLSCERLGFAGVILETKWLKNYLFQQWLFFVVVVFDCF